MCVTNSLRQNIDEHFRFKYFRTHAASLYIINVYAHPRLVSIQKKCKTPIEICENSKKRLQLPFFEKKIRERDELDVHVFRGAHPAGT
jgi:hypothetical protein